MPQICIVLVVEIFRVSCFSLVEYDCKGRKKESWYDSEVLHSKCKEMP